MRSGNTDAAERGEKRIPPFLIVRAVILGAIVIVLIWLQHRLDLVQYFSRERMTATIAAIRHWVDGFGAWGVALFVLASVFAFVVNLPSALLIYISVAVFGRTLGCAISFAIVILGTSFVYGLAQRLGRPAVQRLMGRRWQSIETHLARRELMNITMLRLVFFMNPALNWILGLSGVRFRNLLAGTLIGVGPGIVLLAWLTDEIVESLQSGKSLNLFKNPQLLIPLLLSLVLFGGATLFERVRKHRARRVEGEGA